MRDLIETWFIHHRINVYLLTAIPEDRLGDQAASKGRSVGEQFAHLHNTRLMWLQANKSPLPEQTAKIEKGQITKDLLLDQLEKSSRAIAEMLETGLEKGKISGFKPHPTAFLGYLISHESHHRGQITLSLKQAGHPIDKKVSFGMWEWGQR